MILGGENGAFNNFFDLWNDENCAIDHFNNNAISLNANANWTGSFVFSGGQANLAHALAPVITLRDSIITANYSNGVTVYNSNGLYVENTVIQASSLWQIYVANQTGNYQGAFVKNLYSESSIAQNPPPNPNPPGAKTPFPGTGIGGMIAGSLSGGYVVVEGQNPMGAFQTGGTGSTSVVYFVVAHDTTTSQYTSPMQVLNWMTTGSDTPVVKWPRVANGTDSIEYDIIRSYMTPNSYYSSIYPAVSNCPGTTYMACGYIVENLSQLTACSGGLVCSYTDTGITTMTTAYAGQTSNYAGSLNFWPGTLVAEGGQFHTSVDPYNLVNVGIGAGPLVIADLCQGNGSVGSYAYTQCLGSANLAAGPLTNNPAQSLLDIGGGTPSISKGKLNFQTSPYVNSILPHHIITLIDSQPGLTQGTFGMRPLAVSTDVWLGTDVPSSGVPFTSGQLAMGAPVAISNYINNTGGTGSGWLTQLRSNGFSLATHLNQPSGANYFAGTCTMSASKTCTITLAGAYTSTPGCVVTVQSVTVIAGGCTVSGTTVTVTAASSNSSTWAAMLFGNPN